MKDNDRKQPGIVNDCARPVMTPHQGGGGAPRHQRQAPFLPQDGFVTGVVYGGGGSQIQGGMGGSGRAPGSASVPSGGVGGGGRVSSPHTSGLCGRASEVEDSVFRPEGEISAEGITLLACEGLLDQLRASAGYLLGSACNLRFALIGPDGIECERGSSPPEYEGTIPRIYSQILAVQRTVDAISNELSRIDMAHGKVSKKPSSGLSESN